MGELADRLDRLQIRAQVPGTDIVAVLRDRTDVMLSFAEHSYDNATEGELEWRLANLARLLWAGWTRGYYAEVSAATGRTVTGERPALTEQDRQFREQRAEITARGSAADGRISVAFRGRDLTVHIRRGTVRELTEEEFVAAVRTAANELIEDHQRQIVDLRVRIFSEPLS
jgi:hypothetical protein